MIWFDLTSLVTAWNTIQNWNTYSSKRNKLRHLPVTPVATYATCQLRQLLLTPLTRSTSRYTDATPHRKSATKKHVSKSHRQKKRKAIPGIRSTEKAGRKKKRFQKKRKGFPFVTKKKRAEKRRLHKKRKRFPIRSTENAGRRKTSPEKALTPSMLAGRFTARLENLQRAQP